jgi:hypothetical protein
VSSSNCIQLLRSDPYYILYQSPHYLLLIFSFYGKMGGSGNQMTLEKALDLAKDPNQPTPSPVAAMLERKMSEIWQRIQTRPTSYVMTRDEFAVFSYFRSRYDNGVARQAVSRFWSNYKGDTQAPKLDGAKSSSSNPSNSGS